MRDKRPYRLIISGGGTGGHIFPALAIANEFRERYPDANILFVGAEGRMEMTRVPEAGYPIVGLWISGIQRSLTLSNLLFPVKLLASYLKAGKLVREFKPDVVVGTGGYASGPIMMAATRKKIPSVIQEQNSFAGLTNKQVASKVNRICVAYEGMERYFPREKLVITGNPVRKDILDISGKRSIAIRHFGLNEGLKTLLVIGGSLGARTINESVLSKLPLLTEANVQVIWQTGKAYYDSYVEKLKDQNPGNIKVFAFVKEMDLAYAAADVVVSRSGALAVSEICIVGKPAILVPSPNVAEDHQTKNALALTRREAAVMIKDRQATESLVSEALTLLNDEARRQQLSINIKSLAKPSATSDIVDEIEKLLYPVAE